MELEKKVRLSSISDLYTADTLAEALGISRSMIYYLRDMGKLKAYKVTPTHYVFKREDVGSYLKGEGYAVTQ